MIQFQENVQRDRKIDKTYFIGPFRLQQGAQKGTNFGE